MKLMEKNKQINYINMTHLFVKNHSWQKFKTKELAMDHFIVFAPTYDTYMTLIKTPWL
jgi:hypothetical protein